MPVKPKRAVAKAPVLNKDAVAGGGDILVLMKRLDADKASFTFRVSRETEVRAIRGRIKMEWGIPPTEQVLLFRGLLVEGERVQPFNAPDLDDIVREAGDEGLAMSVAHRPFRLPDFLEEERLESVNTRRPTGATPLHRAVRKCELGVMEEILACDDLEVVDARDRAGQTALHTAVTCRIREAVQILLDSDYSERFTAVGSRDGEGRTALHYIAFWGDLPSCRMLLKRSDFSKEDVNYVDKAGYSAIQYAVDCGHKDIVAAIEGKLSCQTAPSAAGVGNGDAPATSTAGGSAAEPADLQSPTLATGPTETSPAEEAPFSEPGAAPSQEESEDALASADAKPSETAPALEGGPLVSSVTSVYTGAGTLHTEAGNTQDNEPTGAGREGDPRTVDGDRFTLPGEGDK